MRFQQFVNNLNKTKSYLILANFLLVFFLILFNNLKFLPLRTPDFVFFAAVTLCVALYRPSWAFLIFVGTITLENINLAPDSLKIALRPYQFIGALTLLAVFIKLFSKKLNFKLVKFNFYDYLLVGILAGSILSVVNATSKTTSLKLTLILVSFFALYYLVRNYIQDKSDLKKALPFFLTSALIVIGYGIWQNVMFLKGGNNFEVMPGRPNATFTESDWLGMYLVFLISVIYVLLYYVETRFIVSQDRVIYANTAIPETQDAMNRVSTTAILYVFLALIYILLIISVSRSAWVGAFLVAVLFLFAVFSRFRFREWHWKLGMKMTLGISATFLVSIFLIYIFHLTNFQLGNRAVSTGGLQKVTIACSSELNSVPELSSVHEISELEKYGCRHINLEEIDAEKAKGNIVEEIYRDDPNVNIRAMIYQASWAEIKNHYLLGIGWGSIGDILGRDARGASLNSSNIFLEVWLGSGIIGLVCFVVFLGFILLNSIRYFFFAKDLEQEAVGLLLILSFFAMLIPNLFNAGIMLGILWVFLGVSVSLLSEQKTL